MNLKSTSTIALLLSLLLMLSACGNKGPLYLPDEEEEEEEQRQASEY